MVLSCSPARSMDITRIVFLLRHQLYLVAVTTTGEPEPFLQLQLEYLYHQVGTTTPISKELASYSRLI